jgi:hypothetical protein
MKRLAIVLLAMTSPAYALHLISCDYPPASQSPQPTGFNYYCPSTALTPALKGAVTVDTNATNTANCSAYPANTGGLYVYQDLSLVPGATAGVTCAISAFDAYGDESARVNFTLPGVVTAPNGVRVVP